jgi:CRP/FNR family transcriptional regulator, cyclic AMP receptor protein
MLSRKWCAGRAKKWDRKRRSFMDAHHLLPEAVQHSLLSRGLRIEGDCHALAQLVDHIVLSSSLLQDFTPEDLSILGNCMPRVLASPGQILIAEGEAGDWLLLLLAGTVDVTKRIQLHEATDQTAQTSRLAVVRAGASLGEMSMFDSEPRHATCTAIDEVQAGILTRSAISHLIENHPAVGAKLLVKITQLLAQRLRNTSVKLVKAVLDRQQQELFKA